jgi:hypothetical protein
MLTNVCTCADVRPPRGRIRRRGRFRTPIGGQAEPTTDAAHEPLMTTVAETLRAEAWQASAGRLPRKEQAFAMASLIELLTNTNMDDALRAEVVGLCRMMLGQPQGERVTR